MATIESLELKLNALSDAVALILANSTEPKDGTISTSYTDDTLIPIQNVGEGVTFIKRVDFMTAVLGALRLIDDNPITNEVSAVGQLCMGRKTGINNGAFFTGFVTFFPPTTDSHINFIEKKKT